MERGRKWSKLCNPLCCTTQVKSILSLPPPPSQPHVFPPLSFVIVCYYRHYENCYYSDCLDTRIAVGGNGTLGSVDVYSFNCSGKHEPFSAVPQHSPLERRGKWQREGVFDHLRCLCLLLSLREASASHSLS